MCSEAKWGLLTYDDGSTKGPTASLKLLSIRARREIRDIFSEWVRRKKKGFSC